MSTTTFAQLGAQALFPIVIGSFQSLRTPAAVRARLRRARAKSNLLLADDEDDLPEDDDEILTLADSLLFPVLGSAALLGLWALIKYVDKKYIDLVLGVYFSLAGVFAVQSTLSGILDWMLSVFGSRGPLFHFRISSGIKQIFHLPLRISALITFPAALALPLAYVPLGRPWILSNVLALCLATAALAFLRLDGFPTAFLLLGLLLFYDIFWVFYTPVMVTVAKGIEAPIKLLAPKPGAIGEYAMLGLGDVVIPGLLIALCLRFDLARHAKTHPARDVTPSSSFGKSYFLTAVGSYVTGLCVTIYAMQVSGRAQPALLYLSPACVLGPSGLALLRGELGLLWNWRDVEDKVEDDTIEPPAQAAIMARKEAKERERAREAEAEAKAEKEKAEEKIEVEVVEKVEQIQDDSWMESTPTRGKKKKGGKRK